MKRPLLFSVTILMAIIVTATALSIGGGGYSLVWNSIDGHLVDDNWPLVLDRPGPK